MKKFTYLLALLFTASTLFIGCNTDEPNSITVADSSTLTQTVYADQNRGENTVRFTTTAAWTSSITESRSTATWLSITPSSGNAGAHNITLNLQPNTTGADRSAIITITSNGATAEIRITQQGINAPIAVTGVTLAGCNPDTPLAIGTTRQLTATVLPENATNRAVTWASSNNNIATVDNYGLVTAVATGTATITVTTADGGRTATCVVTVPAPIAVTGVTLEGCNPDTPLAIGRTRQLTATIIPSNAANQNVTWASSNNNIATVNNYGLVTAVAVGTATITATTADGNRTATCVVTVVACNIDNPAGVVINGIRWATRNVNMPGTFAQHPESAGRFFRWNRRTGWATTGWVTWDNNDPAFTGTAWYAVNDPCPQGWRVPTQAELTNLRNQPNTWTQRNGVNGRLFGTAPNQMFLPAAGRRHSASEVFGVGAGGGYWSSTPSGAGGAWNLWVNSTRSNMYVHSRNTGLSVRCVAE